MWRPPAKAWAARRRTQRQYRGKAARRQIRRLSSRGGIQVACQKIQVGMTHAGKIVTVVTETNTFRLVIEDEIVSALTGCGTTARP